MKRKTDKTRDFKAVVAQVRAWKAKRQKLRLAWLRAFDCDPEPNALAISGHITSCKGHLVVFKCDQSTVTLQLALPKSSIIDAERSYPVVFAIRNGELVSLMDFRLDSSELYEMPMVSKHVH